MNRLIDGYRRFRAEGWPAQRAQYEELALRGQKPHTMVIGCADSRVDPQTIFGAGPGELFVVRNVAALVPPFAPDGGAHGVSAALEFAVRLLKVERLVVLGHAQCGGVQAAVEGAPRQARDFLEPWMEIAAPALDSMPPTDGARDILQHYEREVVRLSLANLMTFPWIAEAVRQRRLELHGFRFDIRTGALEQVSDGATTPVS